MTTTYYRASPPSSVAASLTLSFACVAGLAAGAGCLWAQSRVPTDWSLVADSGALWTLVAFVVAAACSGPRWRGGTAGGLTLTAEVIGYYAVGAHTGTALASHKEQAFWLLVAVIVGPVAGLAAHAARCGRPEQAVSALAGMAGVLVGEAWSMLARDAGSTAIRVELVAGLVMAAVSLVASRATFGARAGAVVVGGVVAVLTCAAYGSGVG